MAHEVVHVSHRRVAGLDDHVDALIEHLEVEISGNHGHFAQLIVEDVKSRHLAIDPDHAGFLRREHLIVIMCHVRRPFMGS